MVQGGGGVRVVCETTGGSPHKHEGGRNENPLLYSVDGGRQSDQALVDSRLSGCLASPSCRVDRYPSVEVRKVFTRFKVSRDIAPQKRCLPNVFAPERRADIIKVSRSG
jgi:hypothetical protein